MSSAKLPLHAQVAASLREQIHGREFRPGDLLPSEAALRERFDVSRSVIRQALASLEADGLLHKAQGRGTVVTEPPAVHRNVLRSGLAMTGSADQTIGTQVLTCELVRRPARVTSIGGAKVLHLRRLRSVDGTPISLIHTWLPAAFAEHLDAAALTDASLHALLAERAGRPVVSALSQIRAVTGTPELADLLGVDHGAALLLLEGRSLDAGGETLEEFATWHRGDLVAFDVQAAGDDLAPGTVGSDPRPGVRPSPGADASRGVDGRGEGSLLARLEELERRVQELQA